MPSDLRRGQTAPQTRFPKHLIDDRGHRAEHPLRPRQVSGTDLGDSHRSRTNLTHQQHPYTVVDENGKERVNNLISPEIGKTTAFQLLEAGIDRRELLFRELEGEFKKQFLFRLEVRVERTAGEPCPFRDLFYCRSLRAHFRKHDAGGLQQSGTRRPSARGLDVAARARSRLLPRSHRN